MHFTREMGQTSRQQRQNIQKRKQERAGGRKHKLIRYEK